RSRRGGLDVVAETPTKPLAKVISSRFPGKCADETDERCERSVGVQSSVLCHEATATSIRYHAGSASPAARGYRTVLPQPRRRKEPHLIWLACGALGATTTNEYGR